MNKTRENEDLLRMLRLETDLGRYQTFVINAGKVRKIEIVKIEVWVLAYLCIT